MNFIYDPSLVLYLPLYKKDGGFIMSGDAYGHLCTVTSADWGSDGRHFNGADGKIVVPHQASIDNLASFTCLFWIKFNAGYGEATATRIFEKNVSAFYLYVNPAGKLFLKRLTDNIDAKGYTTDAVPANVWNLIGATMSDLLIDIYINGQEVTGYDNHTQGVGTLIDDSGADMTICNSPDQSQTLDGIIGECWWYNRSLNPQEIQCKYLATK